MDEPIHNGIKWPYAKANIFQRLFFSWVWPLVKQGSREEVYHDSMYHSIGHERVDQLHDKLHRAWKKEVNKLQTGGKPSFRIALARAFGPFYLMCGLLIIIEDACRLISPVLMQWLLEYFNDQNTVTRQQAYIYASGIALSAIIQSFIGPTIVHNLNRAGYQWQGGAAAVIYRKAVRLSHTAFAATSNGHITDLIASDVEKIHVNVWFLHSLWRGPVHAAIILTYAYYQMGPAVFTAIAYVIVIIPLQAFIAKVIAHYRKKTFTVMDDRVNIIGEIIGGMRLVKMYCWEKPFGHIVEGIRKKEVKFLWESYIFNAILSEINRFNQRGLTAVIVLVYVYLNGMLNPSQVFPLFAFFNLLSQSLLTQLPWGIKFWFETEVSTTRIEKFLLLEDQQKSGLTHYTHKLTGRPGVLATDACAYWSLDSAHPTLNNISFSVDKGNLLTVVGEVGSGKSSLLLAVCGELPIHSGGLVCGGTIAYVPQQPWVFSTTIRQNILFGQEYNAERYNNALEACSLHQDLSLLPSGDLTLVGDKGVTLSGGQKARISLARAVYTDADVYLLDDPLSAVDAHVGKQLFTKCIKGCLKDKVVILATHQLQYLEDSSKVLVLDKGQTEAYGSYKDLLDSGVNFSTLLPHTEEENTESIEQKSDNGLSSADTINLKKQVEVCSREVREDEDRAMGQVSWAVYWQYAQAGGSVPFLLFVLFTLILTQVVSNGSDWWLSVWSNQNSTTGSNATLITRSGQFPFDSLGENMYAYIYIGLLLSSLLFGLIKSWSLFTCCVRATRHLHSLLYKSVVGAPILFHDTNPKGRIMNRFSSDISSLDNYIPDRIDEFCNNFFLVVGGIVMMSLLNYAIALLVIPLTVSLVLLRQFYLKTIRQVERIVSAATSPILSHLGATLDGIHTIRAFGKEDILIDQADAHYDTLIGTRLTHCAVFCWFYIGISLASGVFNVLAVYACLLVADYNLISLKVGDVGLILSYITSIMYNIQHAVRLSSEVEIEMVKAERVIRYTKLAPEASVNKAERKPPTNWPPHGKIVFDHVSFAYSQDSSLVLTNIFADIQPAEKVGIAGRTGAGKSSLVQCLFRMADPIGEIRIDDIAVNNMGLADLRSRLSIIPQDPFLFTGTVRSNLDPFERYSDDALWTALDEVQMKQLIQDNGGLDAKVTEGGSNFSVGQKQLFCLARAIVKHNKILILDEATAHVDNSTDELIQRTIRQKFSESTVLTIAHRLHTIMDMDRIMVIDHGVIVEFDHPFTLLQNQDSKLYSMCTQNGAQEHRSLYTLAERNYLAKFTSIQ